MNSPTARSPRKAKGQGAERREEILAAALKLFTELGVYAVSTRQIAQAVGISQPTLYAYFPTKDDIGLELHNRAFVLLADRLAGHDVDEMRTVEDCVSVMRLYVDFGLENPDMYRIAFMTEGSAGKWLGSEDIEFTPPVKSTYGVLQRAITAMHGRGQTVDVDPETLTQNIWAAMHGLVSLLIAKPGFHWVEREHLIVSHLSLVARGLLRAPA